MVRAVIFDMDGVLIDGREWHYRSLNRALQLFGYRIGRQEHLASFDGVPTRVKLEKLSCERGLPRRLHGFINELKQAYAIELVHQHCRPTFAHQYALSRLRELGYQLAVASNSIRKTVDLMLDRAGLMPYLDFTLSNEDVTRPKPHPEIYQMAIARLGLSPSECLIVEDNQNGIAAARASGAHVMTVRNPDDVYFEAIARQIAQTNERSSPANLQRLGRAA